MMKRSSRPSNIKDNCDTSETSYSPHKSQFDYLNLNFYENSDGSCLTQPKTTSSSTKLNITSDITSDNRIITPDTVKLDQDKFNRFCTDFKQQINIKDMSTKKNQVVEKYKEITLEDFGFNSTDISDWNGIIQPHKKDLFMLLENMIKNYELPNIKIKIGTTSFLCHLMVLQCYSNLFKELDPLTMKEKEIVLPEEIVTPTAFIMVYDWMLASRPLVGREAILELFTAAQYLRIKDLSDQCWVCLDDDKRFCEDAAFLLYLEAKKFGHDLVKSIMLTRIYKFFLTLVASKEFLELTDTEICTLLQSNSIGVNGEMEVLMAAIRWLNYDWVNREPHMLEVVGCVRFSLMTPWELVNLLRNSQSPEIHKIVSNPVVQKMIEDGQSYVTIKYWYNNFSPEKIFDLMENLKLKEPVERQWIRDKMLKEKFSHETQLYSSYESFLDYLESIKAFGKDHWRTLECQEGCPNETIRIYMFSEKNIQNSPPLPPQLHAVKKTLRNQSTSTETLESLSPKISSSIEELKSLKSENHKKNIKKSIIKKNVSFHDDNFVISEDEVSSIGPIKNKSQIKTFYYNEKYSDSGTVTPKSSKQKSIIDKKSCNNAISEGYCSESSSMQIPMNIQTPEEEYSVNFNYKNNYDKQTTEIKVYKFSFNDECNQYLIKNNKNIIDVDVDVDKNTDYEYNNKITTLTNVSSRDSLLENQYTMQLNNRNIGNVILLFGGFDPHYFYPFNNIIYEETLGNNIYRLNLLNNNDNINDNDSHFTNDYNNKWININYLPEPRNHHSVVLLNDRIYLIGGTRPKFNSKLLDIVDTVWSCNYALFLQYDINSLNKKINWRIEENLLKPRHDFGVIVYKENIYVIGGETYNHKILNSVEIYDYNLNEWSEITPMTVARTGPAVSVHHQLIWVAGGMTSKYDGSIVATKYVEYYNPKTNQWYRVQDLRIPRCFAKMCCIDNILYIVGGAGKNNINNVTSTTENTKLAKHKLFSSLNSIDFYDDNSKKWNFLTEMSIPRHGHDLAKINKRLLIIGGVTTTQNRKTLSSVECFCTEKCEWVHNIPCLPKPLSGMACISLSMLSNKD